MSNYKRIEFSFKEGAMADWHRDFVNPYEEGIKKLMAENPNDGSIIDLCEKKLQRYADGFELGYRTTCESFRQYLLEKAMQEV